MEMIRASAPAQRTVFITTGTSGRRNILQSERMVGLLLQVVEESRAKGRFQLHAYVTMPEHIHLLITPASDVSLEKCMQFIKGGFSFRVGKEFGSRQEIWQAGFNKHWIKDAKDFEHHARYIHMNPVRRGLVTEAAEFKHSSVVRVMDAMPPGLKPRIL